MMEQKKDNEEQREANEEAKADETSVFEQKQLLREKMKTVRDSIPEKERKEQSEALANIVLGTELYETSVFILSYVAKGSEVDTSAIMKKAIQDGKKVYVPKIFPKSKTMDFFECDDLNDLQEGEMGILEPKGDPAGLFPYSMHISLDAAPNCMILVPGLAFDEKLSRLGMGGGYYDWYLSRFKKKMTVGMAFNEQMVEEVPTGPNDVSLDLVVTPKCAYF